MKTQFTYMSCLFLLFFMACNKKTETLSAKDLNKIKLTETMGLTKKYVEENKFIETIDLDKIKQEFADLSKNKYQKPESAKAKAVVYRFYQHVKLIDGKYVVGINNGKVINISEQLFATLKGGIDDTNRLVDSLRQKKQVIELPPVDNAYLSSLLK